jgi:inorganic triphosphatase YgiF
MKRLDDDQLQASPESGARALVSALLRDAEEELKHLEAGGEEALHDFRVALRRVRSVTRALRPYLGKAVRKKHERRLRDAARATALARDAEVQLAWLAQERATGARNIPAIDLLVRRLEERRREEMGRASRRQVARCLVGCRDLRLDPAGGVLGPARLAPGDLLSLDGSTGDVYARGVDIVVERPVAEVAIALGWTSLRRAPRGFPPTVSTS